ncbi:DNA polymerase V subunit UmuC [Salmonella enterica subsp. enterica serovar Choleraesuis str. 0006]|nr:DNA polymerase V subunit UmuC [Salmonella enterica subsp. enterica serovar Choleraesuis str. 0006]
MEVLDHLNAKKGRGKLYFAGEGIQQQWAMKRNILSSRYTTRFRLSDRFTLIFKFLM